MSTTFLFYIAIELVSIFFMFLAQKNKISSKGGKETPKKSQLYFLFLFLSFIIPLAAIGLRSASVGADTANYAKAYYDIANGASIEKYQNWLGLGYIYLCKIIGAISSGSFVVFNFFMGFITLLLIYVTLWRESKYPSLCLFILYSSCLFYQMMNQSRQMLAIAIVFYSIRYIKTKEFIKYFVCVFIAALIHPSALIALPFYFVNRLQLAKKNLALFGIGFVLVLCLLPIMGQIISMLPYGNVYANTEYFTTRWSSVLKLLFGLALTIICLIFNKKYGKNTARNDLLISFSFFYCLFQAIASSIYIFNRISIYFYFPFLLLIPDTYANIKNQKLRRAFLLGMIILFTLDHVFYYRSVAIGAKYEPYALFIGGGL